MDDGAPIPAIEGVEKKGRPSFISTEVLVRRLDGILEEVPRALRRAENEVKSTIVVEVFFAATDMKSQLEAGPHTQGHTYAVRKLERRFRKARHS
jgi:hypothetical protein